MAKIKLFLKRLLLMLAVLLIQVIVVWATIKKIEVYRIHHEGVMMEEPDDHVHHGYIDWYFTQYKVFDKRWSSQELGESGKTIAEYGDFLCCVSIAMSAAEDGMGGYRPDIINKLLCSTDGYDKDGDIKKKTLRKYVQEITWYDDIDPHLKYERKYHTLADFFSMNDYSVLDVVKVKKGEDFRWVVVIDITEDGKDYICTDPQEEADTTYLSDYGNRVYDRYTMGGFSEDYRSEVDEIADEVYRVK